MLSGIGATEILSGYKMFYSIHLFDEGMKSQHMGRPVDKLMRVNDERRERESER